MFFLWEQSIVLSHHSSGKSQNIPHTYSEGLAYQNWSNESIPAVSPLFNLTKHAFTERLEFSDDAEEEVHYQHWLMHRVEENMTGGEEKLTRHYYHYSNVSMHFNHFNKEKEEQKNILHTLNWDKNGNNIY